MSFTEALGKLLNYQAVNTSELDGAAMASMYRLYNAGFINQDALGDIIPTEMFWLSVDTIRNMLTSSSRIN